MMTKNLFKKPMWYLMVLTAGMLLTFTSCDDEDEPAKSSDKAITSFVFNDLDPAVSATISGTSITATVPYTADITSLTPTIAVSTGATVAPASGSTIDFSGDVTFTVTAEDGSTADYIASITQEPVPTAVITPKWELNQANESRPDWFTANGERDLAAYGDYVYVQSNNDRIKVLSVTDGSVVTVGEAGDFIDGKENFSGGTLNLVGIDVDEAGNIIGSNLRLGSADEFPWNVYRWADKDASQELLMAFPTPAPYRLGDNITVIGDVTGNATIFAPGVGSADILKFTIENGEANLTPEVITLSGIDAVGNASDARPVSNDPSANLIVTGTGISNIAEYAQDGSLVGKLPEELNAGDNAILFSWALDAFPFELDGRKMIAATGIDFTSGANQTMSYIYLIDYTDGWANVTEQNITRYAMTNENNLDGNANGTGGVHVIVNGSTATVYGMVSNHGVVALDVTIDQ